MRFLLIFIPIFTLAQDKLTPEKLWEFERISNHQISPNGKLIVFGSKKFNWKENNGYNIIYIIPVNGGTPTPITNKDDNAFAAKFRPDGNAITFLKAVDKELKLDEIIKSNKKEITISANNKEVQLFEYDLKTGKTIQVTNIDGGITTYKYSPTMNYIAFTKKVKLDKEIKEIYPDLDKSTGRIIDGLMFRHWDSWHDFSYSHLFIQKYSNGKAVGDPVDLMKDEKFNCPLPPHGGDDEYNWSFDGNMIAYTSKKLIGTANAISTNSDIYLYHLKTQNTENLSWRNQGYDRNPQFSPDGSKIAWLQMERPGNEADKNVIVMYDFGSIKQNKKGNIKATVEPIIPLTNNFEYSISSFKWVDNSAILFNSVVNATKQIFLFDPKIRSFSQTVPITKGHHDYSEFDYRYVNKNHILVGSKMSMSMPNELFVIDNLFKNNSERQLTFQNKQLLDNLKLGKIEERWITTTDNKKMLTWVIYPPDFDPNKKYPALLYCQGGPQSPLSQYFSYRWNFQLMAANGYIVVAPNRRGLPGFGTEWNDAIIGDYGGQCMRDYLSAIDAVSSENYIDKNKLGAVGASFGGYSVYWLAGNHNKRFKAFIAHCGMFNMESWYGSTEEMFFANNDNEGPYWNQTKSPNNFDNSPHKFVKNWDTPILVIHNEKDFRVPVTQGMEAFTAAQIKGIPSRFLYFPDENHWMLKPQNSILWQRVFFDWLDKYLK